MFLLIYLLVYAESLILLTPPLFTYAGEFGELSSCNASDHPIFLTWIISKNWMINHYSMSVIYF